jgi:type I restriction enzyme S subunit
MERKRFLEIGIPVPSETVQHSLVELHNALSIRREINERLKTQIKDLCPILIKGSIAEAARI